MYIPSLIDGWRTADELKFLRYMASADRRPGGNIPSIEERVRRLEFWVTSVDNRRWSPGIDIGLCIRTAKDLLEDLWGKG